MVDIAARTILVGSLLAFGAPSLLAHGPEGDGHVMPQDPPGLAATVSFGSARGISGGYMPGKRDESVWALQADIKKVRQAWLESPAGNSAARRSLHDSALAD